MRRSMMVVPAGALIAALLGFTLGLADEPAPPPPRLAIQLRDGTLVLGPAGMATLDLIHQSGGRIKVPLDRVETAVPAADGETVSIRLRNGDSLTGVLDLRSITVRTPTGLRDVPADRIALLAVLPADAAKLDDGLVAFYRFEDGGHDASGKGNPGRVHGTAPGADRFDRPDHALCFDGHDDYVEVPASESLRLGESFTVSAWVRTTGAAGRSQYIVRQGDFSVGRYRFGLRIYDTGAGSFNTRDGTDWFEAWTPPLKVGRWHHLVGVHDAKAATLAFYLDGCRVGNAGNVRVVGPGPDPLVIGAEYYSGLKNFFAGQIDDVRIYDRALSAAEVIELHVLESVAPPPLPPPPATTQPAGDDPAP